ncbi:MAG: peptide chain release factor N(5)-glutamine methyltransferase [Phycisphaerae bacterium]
MPNTETWTIQKLLNWVNQYLQNKGVDSPRLSAEQLLSYVLGLKRIELYTQFDKPVDKTQLDKLHDLVKRAGEHEPIAYLTGKSEFYSLEFYITKDCLIPRPETELLVERAVEFLRTRNSEQLVCDLCTGCGCIAAAIAKNFSNAKIIATDISDAALAIAEKNIEKHQLSERIKLLQGDLFEPLIPQLDTSKFDLILCNPPYVASGEYENPDKNVRQYEPKIALDAGADGLDIYRRIIQKAQDFLKDDSLMILEIGYKQGPQVKQLLEETSFFSMVTIQKDYQDNDRIVLARKEPFFPS